MQQDPRPRGPPPSSGRRFPGGGGLSHNGPYVSRPPGTRAGGRDPAFLTVAHGARARVKTPRRERHAGERARMMRPRTYSAQGAEPNGAPREAAAPRPFPPAPVPPGNGGEVHGNGNDRSKCRVKVSAVGALRAPRCIKGHSHPRSSLCGVSGSSSTDSKRRA